MTDLNSRITKLTANITAIDNEIAAIDTEVIGVTAVSSFMIERKSRLNDRKTRMTDRINRLQSIVDNPISSAHQTIIDSINTLFSNKYQGQMESFVYLPLEDRDSFFDLYVQCTTNVQKECCIMHYFQI